MDDNEISILLAQFAQAAKRHQEYSLFDWRNANKAARELNLVFSKLTSQGQKGRERLLKLTENEDPSVSLMAAVYSLNYNPEKSLVALRKLEKYPGFIGFQAEQSLKRWDEGNWQLE